MLEKQIHDILKSVMEKSFPNQKISWFTVEVVPKEMRSKHGDYSWVNKKLRIFDLSEKADYLISTALHEMAHHCQCSIDGRTDHSKRFYEIFKKLIETAVQMGVVEYDVIRTQTDASDL